MANADFIARLLDNALERGAKNTRNKDFSWQVCPFSSKTDRQSGSDGLSQGEQHRCRCEKRPPLLRDVGHMIGTGKQEVIHHAEYKGRGHRDGDHPIPDSPPQPCQRQPHDRSCQDDDVYEQVRRRGKRHVRAGVGRPVDEGDGQMRQDRRRQPAAPGTEGCAHAYETIGEAQTRPRVGD